MSYILQALRRSEQGRDARAEAPPIPLVTPDFAEDSRRPIVWMMAALLVLALAGAVAYHFYFVRGTATVTVPATPALVKKSAEPAKADPPAGPSDPAPAQASGVTTAPAPAEAPPALKPSPFMEQSTNSVDQRRQSEVRDLAEQLEVPRPPRAARAAPVSPTPRETVIPGPAPAAPPPVARADDGVKFLRAMPPDFQRDLPALVVNIHIYSPNESDRILYINNRQYQAGDRVREDIHVEAIVEDGAVLSFRGQRFKLPRPR